jgi:PAS domain S-box-containing protein
MTLGLQARLLFPIGAFALLLGATTIAFGENVRLTPAWLIGLLVLLLVVMATDIEWAVSRPLRGLLQTAQELAQSDVPAAPVNASSGQMRELAAGLIRLRERMQEYETSLAQERSRRQALEQSVRELEDRYALTVERANDGIWEWNVKSGAVDFSLRWKAMLGLTDVPMSTVQEWQDRLHPDERMAVLQRFDNHLNGLTPHIDEEYRLRQGDGQYRWVHSRGTAIRRATGRAHRVIVMDNDVHARKDIENALIQAAEGLSAVSGVDFFQSLMRSLSSILNTRDNLVCYCVGDPPVRARTLAYYSNGEFTENFEYDLSGTSCAAVIDRGEIVYCPTGVCDIWPLEKEFDRDSYIGVPMFDSSGKIIGHFACMDGKAMRQDLPHLALFKIFSVRAAAELERTLLRQKIEVPPAIA